MTGERDCDVVVVGGGLAGLAAARRLAGDGADVVVLEARDRVGGKAWTVTTSDGEYLDLGGQWVGSTQTRMKALADEYDVPLSRQYEAGTAVFRSAAGRATGESVPDAMSPAERQDLFDAYERVLDMAADVPPDEPWNAPQAAAWDATTLETWLDEHLETAAARGEFEVWCRAQFIAEPADISLLFLLTYVRQTPGYLPLEAGEHPEAWTIVGAGRVAAGMAADLGERVRLERPVERIAWGSAGVTAITQSDAVTADYAVLALAPPLAGRIHYDPALPANRDELLQRAAGGAVIKVLAVYDDPFWRADGKSAFVDDATGPVSSLSDATLEPYESGRLVGFVGGDHAREWADRAPDERREAFLAAIADLLDDDRALDPVEYHDCAWQTEEWSRGGYHAYPAPGAIVGGWEAIRDPLGPLHWAGTETATEWYGHMEGAVRSGERAAGEVLDRLDDGD